MKGEGNFYPLPDCPPSTQQAKSGPMQVRRLSTWFGVAGGDLPRAGETGAKQRPQCVAIYDRRSRLSLPAPSPRASPMQSQRRTHIWLLGCQIFERCQKVRYGQPTLQTIDNSFKDERSCDRNQKGIS